MHVPLLRLAHAKVFSRLAAMLLLGLAISQLRAQSVQLGTQQDVASRIRNPSGQQTVEANASDPDLGDLSLVSRVPRPKMFTFYTADDVYYTSNAFLSENHELNDFFWNGRIGAVFIPYATRSFTPRIVFEQNFFRYSDYSRLDFDSQTLLFDVKYSLRSDDSWFLDFSYSLSRLAAPHSSIDEFYKNGLLFASITHTRPIGDTRAVFVGSFGTSLRNGDPSAFDRVTTYLNLAVVYSPIEHLQLSAFLRPDLQFYTNDPLDDSRTDLNLAIGTGVTWTPLEYVSISGGASFIGNYSNANLRDYNVFSPSISIAARISF